jgi:hypothetical protein
MCDIIYRVESCNGNTEYVIPNMTGSGDPPGTVYKVGDQFSFNSTPPIPCSQIIEVLSECDFSEQYPWVVQQAGVDALVPAGNNYVTYTACDLSNLIVSNEYIVPEDEQTIINTHFAGAAFDTFNKDRFGIKGCRITHDPYFLQDMVEILTVSEELESCDNALDSCLGCDLKTVKQRIQTI